MNYSFVTYPTFDKEFKRLFKKYHSLKHDILTLADEISANPNAGIDLGQGFYKYRLAIQSKGKGKRGGARVISMNVIVSENDTEIGFLFIYDKSERANVTDSEIIALKKKNGL